MLIKPQNTAITKAETKVMGLLKQGLSNAAIGAELQIAEKTVKFHLTNIYSKLGVSGDRELMAQMLLNSAIELSKATTNAA